MENDWQTVSRKQLPPPNNAGYGSYYALDRQHGTQQAVSQFAKATEEKIEEYINFNQLSLCFAVDVSTSTTGLVLEQERSAIVQIHKVLSPSRQINARVIPWSSRNSHQAISVGEILNLNTSYGTDPTTIYNSPLHIQILQGSSLWLLLTDGEISQALMEDFAHQTMNHRLHGTSSIIIIFGSTMKSGNPTRPSEADISVGMPIFALAADCLYLYHDISSQSGLVYILQAKGCFKKLLPWEREPTLDRSTLWNDLPRIYYSDLAKVNIPVPKKLGRDEIALGNNMLVNLDNMYSGNLDKKTTDKILSNPISMSSIVLSEVARGRSEKLSTFLATKSREVAQDRSYYSEKESRFRAQTIGYASSQLVSARRMGAPTSASLSPYPKEPLTQHVPRMLERVPFGTQFPDKKLTAGSGFRGTCMRCSRQKPVALLFKRPPLTHSTPNFPAEFSGTSLSFPLAMGVFAETDIISSLIYCENCTENVHGKPAGTNVEWITGQITLKPYNDQPEEWVTQISSAFSYRFARKDVAQVFLAVCDSTLQRLASSGSAPPTFNSNNSVDSQQLSSALSWIRYELLYHADISMSSFSALSSSYSETFAQSQDFYLMECPVEAFAVYIRLEQDFHFINWSVTNMSNIVFRRLLLHLSQAYAQMLMAYGGPETGMLLMPLLFHSGDDQRKKSSFRQFKFKASIQVSDLAMTELLDEENWRLFESLGDLFTPARTLMAPATAVFLHHLIKFGSQDGDSSYRNLKSIPSIAEVISNPRGTSVARSTELIAGLLNRNS